MKKVDTSNINWQTLQSIYDEEPSAKSFLEKTKISRKSFERWIKEGFLIKREKKFLFSEQTKLRISEGRKKWLANNKEKHPWKRKDKFISPSCEFIKNTLRENNFNFVEEFQPFTERLFRADISFPCDKIAIEINGNQHYKGGVLAEYYQNRHDFFLRNGWKILEIRNTECRKDNVVKSILEFLKENVKINKYYDENEIKKIKNLRIEKTRDPRVSHCLDCGTPIYKKAKRCLKCNGIFNRKVNIDKNILLDEIKKYPIVKVASKYGISDNGIKKICKKFNIWDYRLIKKQYPKYN